MRKQLLLSILAIAIPMVARSEPAPTEAAANACEDPRTCAAVEFADALSSEPTGSHMWLGSRVVFEPGRARVYSKDREKLRMLAASWRHNSEWATITVEGYAGAGGGVALAQRRADKISNYLVRYGVAAECVVAHAHSLVSGDAQIELVVDGHVELMIERGPRSVVACRRKQVKPKFVAASTVK
jgi:hypothetical protein